MTLRPLLDQLHRHREYASRAAGYADRFSPEVVARVIADHQRRADAIHADLLARLPELQEDLDTAVEMQEQAGQALCAARERALRGIIGELPDTGTAPVEAAEASLQAAEAAVAELSGLLHALTPVPVPPARTAILVIDDATLYPLREEPVGIGRARSNTVQLAADSLVSRLHCQLTPKGEDWVIEDLGSANGTWISGEAVASRRLLGGEVIQVGGTTLRFEWMEEADTGRA